MSLHVCRTNPIEENLISPPHSHPPPLHSQAEDYINAKLFDEYSWKKGTEISSMDW